MAAVRKSRPCPLAWKRGGMPHASKHDKNHWQLISLFLAFCGRLLGFVDAICVVIDGHHIDPVQALVIGHDFLHSCT